jgi:hypothetical protein
MWRADVVVTKYAAIVAASDIQKIFSYQIKYKCPPGDVCYIYCYISCIMSKLRSARLQACLSYFDTVNNAPFFHLGFNLDFKKRLF